MKRILLMTALGFLLTGCTYNVSMAHTEGTADDVIDDTASPSTTASIPISPK